MCKKILFVDDELPSGGDAPEHGYMWYYTNACANAGFVIEQARSVSQALHALKSTRGVDLVILDVMMPRPDDQSHPIANELETGYALAKRLCLGCPHIPVIVLTNTVSEERRRKIAGLSNVKRFLDKLLYPPLQLVEEVKSILGGGSVACADSTSVTDEEWKEMLHGRRQEVFRKFLHAPSQLTKAEFLLLADVSETVMHSLLSTSDQGAPAHSKWIEYTTDQLLQAIAAEQDRHAKGELLEALVCRLFTSVPGFRPKTRLRTRTEEIDIFILNGSTDPPWKDMGPALIGECKNWTSKCGTPELDHFENKIRNRRGQCRCGFFVGWNGFTSRFLEQKLRSSREDFLIVTMDGTDVRHAVETGDFEGTIRTLWEKAVST